MAENTIDTLSLEIMSNANGADEALDRLVNSLIRLQNSLGGENFGQLSNIANGIRQLTAAMRGFSEIVKTADFTRIATGLNKLSSTNVQGVSDASRAINTLTANLSQIGMISFDSQGIANIANTIAQLGRKTITQATANIPKLTASLSGLISGLNGLQSITFDVSGLSELVSAISRLGGKAATNAIPNIQNLGVALKGLLTTLSTAPNVSRNVIQMAQALAQMANSGSGVASASRGLIAGINGIGTSSKKAKGHTLGLAAAFGKFYATYWLLIRGIGMFRKAIDISSDLTEVQNVVDVTFGKMADKVDELSKHSIQDFGMSELTVKQVSSRFQAMGTAMGFAQDEMSDMSIELTKLAADMASFYNVEQAAVAEDLAAIFTGQTRPLRTYGLDLTQATLQEWALKQGMEANIKTMSQAEKTLLRYQYVMANTGAAQGDFARTQGTWANQIRILAQSFQALGAVIGGVMINAFKPFISALNTVMQAVLSFARTVANALGAIFGWTIEIGGGALANDFEAAGAGAEEMADGTGKAADNAKKLNKYIAAWHEVNNMTTNDPSGGGGGGGGGAGGGGAADGAQASLVRTESILEKYKSEIDSLYKLGKYIGDTLTSAMNNIDWPLVYQGAKNFGTGLADFLNGLISPELFGATGRTIAGALNTAIYASLSFGETFDWKNFGESIASGVNNFFATFDFVALAKTINTWAHGIFDAAISAIDGINWSNIGERIGEFLENIDFSGIGAKAGKSIWKAINAGFELYKSMFRSAPFETAILSLVNITKLLKSTSMRKFFSTLSKGIKTVNLFGNALLGNSVALQTLSTDFPRLSGAVNVLNQAFRNFQFGVLNGNMFTGINQWISTIRSNLTGMQKGTITAAAAFAEFGIVKSSVSDIITGTGNLAVNIAKLGGSAGIASAAMYTALGPAGLAVAAVTGLAAGIKGIDDAMETMAKNSAIGQFTQSIGILSDEVAERTENVRNSINATRGEIESAGIAEAQIARDLAGEYEELSKKESLNSAQKDRMKEVSQRLVEIIPDLQEYIDNETGSLNIQKDTLDAVIQGYESLAQKKAAQEHLVRAYEAQYEAQMNVKHAQDGYNEAFNQYLTDAGLAPDVIQQVADGQLDLNKALLEFEKSPNAFAEKYGVKDFGTLKKAVNGLNEELEEYKGVLDDAKKAEKEVGENIDYMNNVIDKADQKLKQATETERAAKLASDEYKQSISDLTTDLDSLGVSLSENLMQNLALDGFDTSSLTSFFDAMTSGVQQSSVELQNAFQGLGLSLPDDLAKALSQKAPEVQAETVKILMSIQSGLQVTKPKIATLFSNLGLELPDSLVENLASKGSVVQAEAVNLLSKIEDGYKLTKGNLTSLFASLGLEVPQSLISALSGSSADVQSQAIELLGQISAAEESERQPLIDKFNSLGVGVADEGIIKALTDKESETTTKTQAYIENGVKKPLVDEKQKIYDQAHDDGSQVVAGVNKGIEDNQNSTRGVIGTWVSKITGWFKGLLDINSPSGVFEDYAGFTVKGFNSGILDNMKSTYGIMQRWSDEISNGFSYEVPKLDLSMPQPDFTPKSYNLGAFQSTMQMEMDAKMAEMEYQNQQLRNIMEENNNLLQQINDRGIILDDNEFNRRYKSGATKYRKQTGRQLGIAY